SLMEFALFDAVKLGVNKFVFIINDQFPEDYKSHLTEVLSNNDCKPHFVEQTIDKFVPEEFQPKLEDRQKPLGTAHAVYCAKDIINEPFITVNADDFYGFHTFETAFECIKNYEISNNKFAMMAFKLKNTLSKNGTVSRGVCETNNQLLKGVEEFTSIEKTNSTVRGLNEQKQEKTLDQNTLV